MRPACARSAASPPSAASRQRRYPSRVCSHSSIVSANTAASAWAIGSARLVKRFACSICTKLTASRSASMTASRFAALVGKRLNSWSSASSALCAAPTLASGTSPSHALHASGSTNSGVASAASAGSSKSLMRAIVCI